MFGISASESESKTKKPVKVTLMFSALLFDNKTV